MTARWPRFLAALLLASATLGTAPSAYGNHSPGPLFQGEGSATYTSGDTVVCGDGGPFPTTPVAVTVEEILGGAIATVTLTCPIDLYLQVWPFSAPFAAESKVFLLRGNWKDGYHGASTLGTVGEGQVLGELGSLLTLGAYGDGHRIAARGCFICTVNSTGLGTSWHATLTDLALA